MIWDWEELERQFDSPEIKELVSSVESQWEDDEPDFRDGGTAVRIGPPSAFSRVPVTYYGSAQDIPVNYAPFVHRADVHYQSLPHQHDKGISLKTAVYLSIISFSSWLMFWVALILTGVIK